MLLLKASCPDCKGAKSFSTDSYSVDMNGVSTQCPLCGKQLLESIENLFDSKTLKFNKQE